MFNQAVVNVVATVDTVWLPSYASVLSPHRELS